MLPKKLTERNRRNRTYGVLGGQEGYWLRCVGLKRLQGHFGGIRRVEKRWGLQWRWEEIEIEKVLTSFNEPLEAELAFWCVLEHLAVVWFLAGIRKSLFTLMFLPVTLYLLIKWVFILELKYLDFFKNENIPFFPFIIYLNHINICYIWIWYSIYQ